MAIADDIAAAFKSATKDLHKEKKQRERDARRRTTPQRTTYDRVTLREAVFRVMDAAVAATSGDGAYRFPCRNLFYAVRPRIQELTDEELKYGYFSQTLVVDYERQVEPITGMYRDPRGTLHEPHTGKSVPLGTLEVADYVFPRHVFDKILYVEKEGLTPIFESAQLAERFDMAIAAGKGQPVEAVRSLFKRAERGEYRLFVLHDADPAGYSIARTIAEATRRMPNHRVDVVDLGLTVDAAIDRGLETESFTRRKALPQWMHPRLTDQERDWFQGRLISEYPRQWECARVELNALTAPDLIAYIEEGLATHDADQKITPPDDAVAEEAETAHKDAVRTWVESRMADWLDVDQVVDTIVAETAERVVTDPAEWISEAYEEDQATYWRTAVSDRARERLDDLDEALRPRLRELLDLGPEPIGGG